MEAVERVPAVTSSARPSGWARIETVPGPRLPRSCDHRSARPSGWARIETRQRPTGRPNLARSPGLRAGRGLKPPQRRYSPAASCKPGLRAGRGLKRSLPAAIMGQERVRARPSGWARIETIIVRHVPRIGSVSARPSGWARIETCLRLGLQLPGPCTPGLRAGRGLKHGSLQARSRARAVAPGLRAGRGLKRSSCGTCADRQRSARPSGWARIETDHRKAACRTRQRSRPAFGLGED